MSPLIPEISPSLLAFIRVGYGLLVLLTLAWAWPNRRGFFLSERWGGYAQSTPAVDRTHNTAVAHLLLAVWAAAAAALVAGVAVVPAATINVLLCRYYFVHMRWKGVLRGMGAPGFMSYWLGAAVWLLELTGRHAPGWQGVALLTLQVDFAFIMLSAGIYKWSAGYSKDEGMDYGMVNPEWGYWWRLFLRLRPGHPTYRFLNQMAWSTEVVAAFLMLVPATRAVGGLIISLSFLLIFTQIRLAWLTEMVMLCGLLLVPSGHPIDTWIGAFGWAHASVPTPAPQWLVWPIGAFFWSYLALIPVVHAGLWYNFYARARLPGVLQPALERYTNFFGIIVWRVFSVDHLDFFIRVYRQPRAGGTRVLVSRYGSCRALRYAHVGECIVVTTLFTTLRYYPGNDQLFADRFRRYARTIPCDADAVLAFDYVSVRKQAGRFVHVATRRYLFDPVSGAITEEILDPVFDPRASARTSPIHEGARPGSYAPAASPSA